MKLNKNLLVATWLVGAVCSPAVAALPTNYNYNYNEISEAEFAAPPVWAKPKTWLHSMSSNMSKEGFTKDLEAIADVGIGGVLLFNVDMSGVKKGDVLFGGDKHTEILKHAAVECDRLGLQFGLHNCDGWTSSGGPWNTPENSMKMVVSSSKVVNGGGARKIALPEPSRRRGYYEDIAVIAYPTLPGQYEELTMRPKVTSSDPKFDVKIANDELLNESTFLNGEEDKDVYVQFEYAKPYTVSRFDMLFNKGIKDNPLLRLSVSDDGVNFKVVQEMKAKRLGKTAFGYDNQFEPVTARYFRVNIYAEFEIREINLRSTLGVDDYLEHISMYKRMDYQMKPMTNEGFDSRNAIKSSDIIDLTDCIDENGYINTTLPRGRWTIARYGYTTSEYVNSPASDAGRGLEVDKMNRKALKIHFEAYVGRIIKEVRDIAPNALQYMEIDSYEVGCQNWTHDYDRFFKERFEYDIVKFLPLYDGLFVDSPEVTEKVAGDMREMCSFLVTENYFRYFTELCNSYGLKSYIEPYSINGPFSELDATKYCDIPMGEFWMHNNFYTATSVSGGRIYGKRVISSEAFTSRPDVNWMGHPGYYKTMGDEAWCQGLNEYMFHRYAHQPNTNVAPGMTMGPWGSNIDRTQTWWESAGKAWMKYNARGQYMLQKGIPISDMLLFVGDGTPSHGLKRNTVKIPKYLNYDCVNVDVLCNRIKLVDGRMLLPEGGEYSILAMKNTKTISLPVLRRVNEYSKGGVVVIAERPNGLIGYKNSAEEQAEYEALVEEIFSRETTYTEYEWDEILRSRNYVPDLEITNGTDLSYTHRRLPDGEIYFFYNADSVARVYDCRFRVEGKRPELWRAVDGSVERVAEFKVENGITEMSISLNEGESVFIVFQEDLTSDDVVVSSADEGVDVTISEDKELLAEVSAAGEYTVATNEGDKSLKVKKLPASVDIDGEWSIIFGKGSEKEKSITSELFDWRESKDEDIKYFSGTANYTKSFTLGKEYKKEGVRMNLSIENAYVAVRVKLNGEDLGVIWRTPFTLDITDAAVAGENKLEVEVTNLWSNRLIGDEHLPNTSGYGDERTMPAWYLNNEAMPKSERSTFTVMNFYNVDSPLMPSGIFGDVKIETSYRGVAK